MSLLVAVVLSTLLATGFPFPQDGGLVFEGEEAMMGDRPAPRPQQTAGTKIAPVTVPTFAPNETYCYAQNKVLYPDGRCYKLREQGPCANETEWLVLDKDEAIRPGGSLRPVCKTCPCCNQTLRVYWPEDGLCHKLSEKQTLCPFAGTVLRSDPFGEGECACNKQPPHARYAPEVVNSTDAVNGVCYPLYRRGPCAKLNILTSSVLKGFGNAGRCTPDPCHARNARSPNASYALHAGDNVCYRLGSRGPCSSAEETFSVHPVSHTPRCVRPVNIIFQLPDRCPTDAQGNCQQEINLPEDDKTTFALELLMSAEKRKKRRSRNALE